MSNVIRTAAVLWLFSLFISPSPAQVVINELHYDPPVKTELAEFIELYNAGEEEVDLGGWRFDDGVSYEFPAGTRLPAKSYLVVAQDPAVIQGKFGTQSLGPWQGVLANSGERVRLVNAQGEVMDEVTYRLGFPWPTVGEQPGYSIELIHPRLDNDLGGSWRASFTGASSIESTVLIPIRSEWKYRKGTAEASSPVSAWRQPGFNDAQWSSGPAPIGYDPDLPMGTTLNDMRNNYTSVFMRRTFQVENASSVGTLRIFALYDDGFKVWINGQPALNVNIASGELPYNGTAGPARESSAYEEFVINSPAFLVEGDNIIAIQAHNSHISNSSDFYIDLRMVAEAGPAGAGPTPGRRNSVYAENAPPQMRQVNHSPSQPGAGEPVVITVKATDPDGIGLVTLSYQIVEPGAYIELGDAAYEANWTSLEMRDDGTNGDQTAGDSVFTGVIPASVQQHRRLVRYRIEAEDTLGNTVRGPYLDDPCPNFAYYVYNGVPSWSGAIDPASGTAALRNPVTYSSEEMSRLPVYHLIARRQAVEDATWNSRYGGDEYRWRGTLVYDGEVYDHIRYRARGGVWRYAMGKNMWKFDFNRGHDFRPRDNYGNRYSASWRKLNLGAAIQQGDYLHRGEQGMFESVGFRLFNLAGVEAPKTHWVTFRVVDDASETGPNQYQGDFWGLYLAVEQMNGRFLDEHGLPDGNLYKMESYTGELNNQGRTAASDKSDLNSFLNTYRGGGASLQWWRQNLDTEKYFSYQAIVQGIHHYDICDGKNYFYYLNPETSLWSVHAWDLDLTWANNMYRDCAGTDDLKNRVLANPTLAIEHRNRLREIRDLLFNSDQAGRLIDEFAAMVKGPHPSNILGADRAMWDYNPIMNNSSIVNLSKAGHGRFYTYPLESGADPSLRGNFDAGVRIMKNYVEERSGFIDGLAHDNAIPARPGISYTGSNGFPVNSLAFRATEYSGANPFAAMAWRIGEVRAATSSSPGIYEIDAVWQSGELSQFAEEIAVPPGALRVGREYRARVRMKDSTGRWSHWSEPVEFVAAQPSTTALLEQHLRITELMYQPMGGNEWEYIEIYNQSPDQTLQLGGVAFTAGIDFVFPAGAALLPGQYGLVTKFGSASAAPFRERYGLDAGVPIFGPVTGNLSNQGEQLTLRTSVGGSQLISFTYQTRDDWPIAAAGPGHSLVPLGRSMPNQGRGSLEYSGNWRASAFIDGSPGAPDEPSPPPVLINEISAHTDYTNPARPEYDSNDWIELINPGNAAVTLRDYYLSDSLDDLRKWAMPETTIPAGGRVSFDEVNHFHNPITTGFGLNKGGEMVIVSHLPASGPARVVDALQFTGQASEVTWGRYPDAGPFFYIMDPTRNAPNASPAFEAVITEVMYHPADDASGVEHDWLEYIEIHNPSSQPLALFNSAGNFRVSGGVSFDFPPATQIPAGGVIVLVNFDPADPTLASAFRSAYDASGAQLIGPYTTRLSNSNDRIALEKPENPDIEGDPIIWVKLDEVIYLDHVPFPDADGSGDSLTRLSFQRSGNDPANWIAAAPSPGVVPVASADTDGDGMPDDWELAHGLDPNNPNDAGEDADGDGSTNLEEFLAGTDPRDPDSVLALEVETSEAAVSLAFQALPGRSYSILKTTSLADPDWVKVRDIPESSGRVEIIEETASSEGYYRIVTPSLP